MMKFGFSVEKLRQLFRLGLNKLRLLYEEERHFEWICATNLYREVL